MKVKAVFGPPGTGKTRYMMDKIAELKEQGHRASEIGFLSFTKAAANEALSRLDISRSDKVSTIHAACFRLLGLSSIQVVDNKRLSQFCDLVGVPFRGGNVEEGSNIEVGDEYLAIIALGKNRLEDLNETYSNSGRPGSPSQFSMFASTYDKWKRANGFLDFTDMLEVYLQRPVSFGCSAVLVDEAQDISPLQWKVIDKLVVGADEVIIAGDDDQSIYVWGGADPKGMVYFEEKYNAERIILDQSWRIPASVHKLATRVIDQIEDRVHKPYRPRLEEGTVQRHSHMSTVKFPADGSIMVLYRNHAIRKDIEKDLIARRIPYTTGGGFTGLFDNKYAHATRTFLKIKRGDTVSEDELNGLYKNCYQKAKVCITERDFAALTRMQLHHAIEYPGWMIDFYRDADMFAPIRIKLSSIHSSKGREADTVILCLAMTTSTFEDYNNDPDAEHRVFYVGITRAKHNLIIVDGFNAYNLPR